MYIIMIKKVNSSDIKLNKKLLAPFMFVRCAFDVFVCLLKFGETIPRTLVRFLRVCSSGTRAIFVKSKITTN